MFLTMITDLTLPLFPALQGSTVFNGTQSGVSQLIQREFQTTAVNRDIDTAANLSVQVLPQ